MKVAVIGAKGQLGQDLLKALEEKGDEAIALAHEDLDVTDLEATRRTIREIAPHVVVNTAAFHKVDLCEDEPAQTFAVNASGARHVAMACAEAGAVAVFFSTDYVFGGEKREPYREEDRPNPLSVYGVSKLAGELATRITLERHFVIRTTGLYGLAGASGKGGNFVETMLRLAREGKSIRVVEDQVLTPTYTVDLAERVVQLLHTDAYGLYHMTSTGECSWYEFARTIFELAGLTVDLSPTTSTEFGAKARRPAYSVLDNVRMREVGIPEFRPWREALKAYLEARGLR
jgi:dTDP-4-dehydrorhamnose reductase